MSQMSMTQEEIDFLKKQLKAKLAAKQEKRYGANEILPLMRKHPEKFFKLDKRKALADLGYNTTANVDREIAAANDYRAKKGLKPLLTEGRYTNPETGRATDKSYTWTRSTEPKEGSSYHGKLDLHGVDWIRNRTTDAIEKDHRVAGYEQGDVSTAKGILGHELTHALTVKPDMDLYTRIGSSGPSYSSPFFDKWAKKISAAQYERLSYPELSAAEFAPPLAAMTRLEYQKTGKRITTPEQFDKKIAQYDAMSSDEKAAFRKSLPDEVSRFYGHLDTVTEGEPKSIQVWDDDVEKGLGKTISGKDRRKRFLDISRDMIPSLVKRQESTDKLLKRRRV